MTKVYTLTEDALIDFGTKMGTEIGIKALELMVADLEAYRSEILASEEYALCCALDAARARDVRTAMGSTIKRAKNYLEAARVQIQS